MRNQQNSAESFLSTAKASATPLAVEEVVQTSFRLSKTRWKRLKELSLDERSSVQSIIVGALEAEFARRGIAF